MQVKGWMSRLLALKILIQIAGLLSLLWWCILVFVVASDGRALAQLSAL